MTTRDETIDIKVDGAYLAGTLIAPATKIPGVLFVHGWGGSQEQYVTRAREIAALGCVCLTFDLRGHALTEGQQETVTRESNLRDVLAAYDVLSRQPEVDPESIAVVGSSYGGYMAAILSGLRPIRWLALRVPALYMDADWNMPKKDLHKGEALARYRSELVPANDNRALRACSSFNGDVLIVESERDQIVPHTVIKSYVEACVHARSLTYRILDNADHGLSDEASQRAYTTLLVNWFSEMIFGARQGSLAAQAKSAALTRGPERPG